MTRKYSRHITLDMEKVHKQLKTLSLKPPYTVVAILRKAWINQRTYYVAKNNNSAPSDMLIDLHNIGIILDDDILQQLFPWECQPTII